MKKLMICLRGLPLALSGCVSDEEVATPQSWGAQLIEQERENEAYLGLGNGLALTATCDHPNRNQDQNQFLRLLTEGESQLAAHVLGTANQQ
jgi:hypothetical protein